MSLRNATDSDEERDLLDREPRPPLQYRASVAEKAGVALLLAARTPRGRATADHCVAQRRAVTRANAVALPLLMNQPIFGRIGEIFPESVQRFPNNEFCCAKNRCAFARA